MWTKMLAATVLLIGSMGLLYGLAEKTEGPSEEQKIAEEAYIYGLPMVMTYHVIYDYAIDKDSGQYKGPFNQIVNEDRVFTPKDTSVITPNSDTPYSFLMMDLRTEPLILCVPEVEKERYYSVQLISLYTFNFGYIGSRATGNQEGCYAVVGPNWKGDLPPGIKKVFRSETEIALAAYRTQLFSPDDMANVRKVQSGYKAVPLSSFMNKPAPEAPKEVKWPIIDKNRAEENPFSYLNFLLQFAPPIGTADVEIPLRERFAKIGIEPGKPFPLLDAEMQMGIRKGEEKIKQKVGTIGAPYNGWQITKNAFGDRSFLKGDYLTRAAAAMVGIFGNDAVEALYPVARVDVGGEALDGSKHKYTLTFAPNAIPPVNAFWSVTMYDAESQLLVENPINRYLINSPMLPNLKKNQDGSVTLYIQKDAPGSDKEANWLPASNGPFYLVMRLYWPKEEALNGTWTPPAIKKAD